MREETIERLFGSYTFAALAGRRFFSSGFGEGSAQLAQSVVDAGRHVAQTFNFRFDFCHFAPVVILGGQVAGQGGAALGELAIFFQVLRHGPVFLALRRPRPFQFDQSDGGETN